MSESNWTFLITVIQTLGIAYISVISMRARREVGDVKKIVNGPLSLALKANAELARRVADITEDHDDIRKAIKAEIISENREEGKLLQ